MASTSIQDQAPDQVMAPVADTLLSLAKENRYISQLTYLLSQTIHPFISNICIDDTNANDSNMNMIRIIQPELNLFARLIHSLIILQEGRSIGQEYLHLHLTYNNNFYKDKKASHVRSPSSSSSLFISRHHNVRKMAFVLLYTFTPYLIQRAGRNGWDDIQNILKICIQKIKRTLCLNRNDQDLIQYQRQHQHQHQLNQRNSDMSNNVHRERLRGEDRRLVHEEMRKRMLERAIQEEEKEEMGTSDAVITQSQNMNINTNNTSAQEREEEVRRHTDTDTNTNNTDPYLQTSSRQISESRNSNPFMANIRKLQQKLRIICWNFFRRLYQVTQLPPPTPVAHQPTYQPITQQPNNDTNNNNNNNTQNNHENLVANADTFTSFMKWMIRFNLALFYVNGKYPTIIHRITNMTIMNNHTKQGERVVAAAAPSIMAERPSYTFVGGLIIFQVGAKLIQGLTKKTLDMWFDNSMKRRRRRRRRQWNSRNQGQSVENNNETIPSMTEIRVPSTLSSNTNISYPDFIQSDNQSTIQCAICMSSREHPAASTTCGHVFCWNCIQHWIATVRPECPLCRSPTKAQDVIALYNYTPSR